MAKKESEEVEAVAKEAVAEAKAKESVKGMKAREKVLNKLVRTKDRALKEARQGPNLVQILGTAVTTGGVAVASYKANRWLRGKTVEWGMVIPEGEEGAGERTTGAKVVSDGILPIVGLVSAGIGLAMKNGLATALLVGPGFGLIAGSVCGTLQGDTVVKEAA